MDLNATQTSALLDLARQQIISGRLDPELLQELQQRYASQHCPSEDRTLISEFDRDVLIPHFGVTKLPPLPRPLPSVMGQFRPTAAVEQKSSSSLRAVVAPAVQVKPTREAGNEKLPATLQEAFLQAFWKSRGGKLFVFLVVIAAAAYAVFAILPEQYKQKILDYFFKR